MDETSPMPHDRGRGFWSWLGFWVQFLILGALAVIGAFFASEGAAPGDYACGMLLILGAVVLAFMRLRHALDGGNSGWGDFLLVADMKNLAFVIPLFVIIGLAGLFVAHAWERGSMHMAGLGLFIMSGLIVFLDIKHVFDRSGHSG